MEDKLVTKLMARFVLVMDVADLWDAGDLESIVQLYQDHPAHRHAIFRVVLKLGISPKGP